MYLAANFETIGGVGTLTEKMHGVEGLGVIHAPGPHPVCNVPGRFFGPADLTFGQNLAWMIDG